MTKGFEVHISDTFGRASKKITDPFLKDQINTIVEDIENGILPGDYIKDKPYPQKYKDFSNLYEIRISDNWRLIYSLIGFRKERICLLVNFMDHDEYDRLFHHKGS